MHTLARHKWMVAPLAAAIVLAACSGGSEPATATRTGTSPAPTATVAPTPVTTRVLTPTGAVTTPTVRPEPTPSISTPSALSETPDRTTWSTYFKESSIAQLPLGVTAGPGNCPKAGTVYTSQNQFCTVYDIKKIPPPVTDAIYDVTNKTFVRPKAAVDLPKQLTGQLVVFCSPVTWPAGKYEYKVWAGDVLVSATAFEVR